MATIRLNGYITEMGEIKVDLPENHPVGEVHLIIIETPREDMETPGEIASWTQEELDDMLNFNPVPASEIETGGWENLNITDSVEFVEELRRKERERRGWQQYS